MVTGWTEEEHMHRDNRCQEKREEGKRKCRRLSNQKRTEMDERKWKVSEKADSESIRQAPVEQLWE